MSRTDHHPVGAGSKLNKASGRPHKRPQLNKRSTIDEHLVVELDLDEQAHEFFLPTYEPIPEWERELLNYRSPAPQVTYLAADDDTAENDEDDDDVTPPTLEDLHSAGHGFLVTGPASRHTRLTCEKARVWQIARELGLPSRNVVAMLRRCGEYVTCSQSTVVYPVAREFIAQFSN